jgi:hypothetical protein
MSVSRNFSTQSADLREAGAPEIHLNIDMVRAGVEVLENWDPESEPEQCLVGEIFYAMLERATGLSVQLLFDRRF